jgi:hypothetical protein
MSITLTSLEWISSTSFKITVSGLATDAATGISIIDAEVFTPIYEFYNTTGLSDLVDVIITDANPSGSPVSMTVVLIQQVGFESVSSNTITLSGYTPAPAPAPAPSPAPEFPIALSFVNNQFKIVKNQVLSDVFIIFQGSTDNTTFGGFSTMNIDTSIGELNVFVSPYNYTYIKITYGNGIVISNTVNILASAPAPAPEPSPAPAPAATPTPVVINFNVTVDASSNLTIFGMSPPTEPADTIVAEYQLPVNALYDPSECLIEFWEEDNSENQIKCQLANVNTAASGGFDLSGAYQKTAKRLARGLQKVLCNAFDCSKAAPYSENKYASVEYYKQRDFGRVALGTFAHYLFGHVDATAAITNDIGFITGMLSLNGSNAAAAATNEGVSGPAERYGAWSKVSEVANNNVQSWSTAATDSDVNLAIRLVKTIVNKGLSGGEPVEQVVTDISTIDATNNTLAYIAAQVLGQDATRMMGHDNAERAKNIHQPLKFISGDVIYMNIKLPMPSVTISPNAAGSASTNSLATKYVQERSYTLKITLGAADATLGGSNLDIALEIPGL